MTATESMKRLREGAERYEARGTYPGNVSGEVRERTADGQHPSATIVTCSDSRVIPEAIFSCGIGDIFVIRTAGSVIGAHELASIEYAAHHLHVPLTVVLGHTHCGAVGAAIAGETEGNVGVITRAIREAIGGETDPLKATRLNAENSVRRIREDLQGGEAHRVCGAVYDIESGHVTWLENEFLEMENLGMTTEKRLDKAREFHELGYNCAQSVTCAFADKTDVPMDVLFAANEGYGAGQGTMDGVCGALMGAIMLGGLQSSSRNLAKPDSKAATMKLSRELMKSFEASAGALYCKDLKGVETGKVICTCPDCIRKACELAAKLVYGSGESK